MRVSHNPKTPIQPGELEPGLTGFISWRRLEEALRSAGEITARERIVSMNVDARGISYKITIPSPTPRDGESE